MATLLEPPALLSLAIFVGITAGATYYGLRPALRGPLPATTSERDEVWGTEDPPPPPKRPYVYPTDRPVAVEAQAEEPVRHSEPGEESEPSADDEEEVSLADLFRPRRNPPPSPPSPPAEHPNATTEG